MAAAKQPPSGKLFPLTSQTSAPSNFQSLQQMAPPATGSGGVPAPPTMSPVKAVNAATFCKVGQEMIHEIINKVSEIFNVLGKQGLLQLPNNVNYTVQNYQDRKLKLEEQLKALTSTFKKLRAIYDKVEETCYEMEQPTDEQLIPIVGKEVESFPVNSEVYPYVLEEHHELVKQVRVKNQQLKEIIDQIRSINWEINTMITMRKT